MSICSSASCIKQCIHERVKIIVAPVLCDLGNGYISLLQHFLGTRPIATAGKGFHFSPTSVWASSISLSLEQSHYWCLWKWNEWERKGTDGRSWPRGLWGVRMHKLITWYWWRYAHLKRHLYPSALTTSTRLTTKAGTEVWGGNDFLLKWCSQTAINTTFESHLSEITWNHDNEINAGGQMSVPSLWYHPWFV